MSKDSINKRFLYKVTANIFKMLINAVAFVLVPRALGPFHYGIFNFLKTFFNTVVGFFQIGTQQAFFIYNSKHDNSYGNIIFYSFFVLLLAGVITTGSALSIHWGFGHIFWPQCEIPFVSYAVVLGIFTWIMALATGYADSKGETVKIEIIKLISNFIGICALVALFVLNVLNIDVYFLYSIGLCVLTILLSLFYYKKQKLWGDKQKLTRDSAKSLARYYFNFSAPLFVYSAFSFLYDIYDRWFLQTVAGSVEQAYYSLGFNFASLCLMIVSAMTPIFMQEVAAAHGKNSLKRMGELFSKYSRIIYFIVVVISVFLSFHTIEVLKIFHMEQYFSAAWPFFVMCIYPVNAVFGQMSASLYFASERTASYRNIGIFNMFLGVFVTYFLLAPKTFSIPGIDLGAMGLALKKFFTQFFSVNLLTYFNCRYLKIDFTPIFIYQIAWLLFLSGILWMISGGTLTDTTISTGQSYVNIALHGIIYCSIVAGMVFVKPGLAGLSRNEVNSLRGILPWVK